MATGYDPTTGRRWKALNGHVVEVIPSKNPGYFVGLVDDQKVCECGTRDDAIKAAERAARSLLIRNKATPAKKGLHHD